MGVRSYTLRYTEVRVVLFSLSRSLSELEVVLNGNHRIVAVDGVLLPPPFSNYKSQPHPLAVKNLQKHQLIKRKRFNSMFPEILRWKYKSKNSI